MERCVVELPREHAGRFVAYVVGPDCRPRVLAAAAELEELLEELRKRASTPGTSRWTTCPWSPCTWSYRPPGAAAPGARGMRSASCWERCQGLCSELEDSLSSLLGASGLIDTAGCVEWCMEETCKEGKDQP